MKLLYSFLILSIFLSSSCGKKTNPRPLESLNIPQPVWAEISVEESSVYVKNNSDDYSVLLERAESEVGDLFFPIYQTLATIKPNGVFVDNNTRKNVRYIYRIKTIHNKYNEYSSPITRVVSYKGVIEVESLQWSIESGLLCLDIGLSRDVANHRVMINGKEMDAKQKCHQFPKTPSLLLVVVPYSDSGIPGSAYSEIINLASEIDPLPPQNIKILRMERRITLSWQAVAGAERYEITATDGSGKVVSDWTKSTIFNSDIISANRCTEFTIVSVSKNSRSEVVKIQSCP
ncbi:MAG: hypothetical protein LBH05_02410 [Deferribacteraceae bacterium]|jgi:hypothetical protein|nr:hypothetical protein [Deferribacteraceae bacterium]